MRTIQGGCRRRRFYQRKAETSSYVVVRLVEFALTVISFHPCGGCRCDHALDRSLSYTRLLSCFFFCISCSLGTPTGDTRELRDAGQNSDRPTTTTKSAPRPTTSNGSRPRTATERRSDFAIRPGYSSGASSYDGSVGDDLTNNDVDDELNGMQKSRHSDILALSDLRQEMVAEGDLTKTVVRIEVRRLERGWGSGARGWEIALLTVFVVCVSHRPPSLENP
jgi:hypothetical protein